MSTTPGDFQISDRVRRELYSMIREFWKRQRPASGPGFKRLYPLAQGFTPSYGGFHVTSTAWTGPDWTTATFATDFPVTSDITLNHAAGTITFSTAGTYMVHGSLSIYGNTEEFEWQSGEAANWLLRVVQNPAGAATVVHVEESHLHGWTTGAGSDATGHCAFSVPVTVAANDVLVLQWQGPLDTGGADRHGDCKYGAFSVGKISA